MYIQGLIVSEPSLTLPCDPHCRHNVHHHLNFGHLQILYRRVGQLLNVDETLED